MQNRDRYIEILQIWSASLSWKSAFEICFLPVLMLVGNTQLPRLLSRKFLIKKKKTKFLGMERMNASQKKKKKNVNKTYLTGNRQGSGRF